MASKKKPASKPRTAAKGAADDRKPASAPLPKKHHATDTEVMLALKKNANVVSRAAEHLGITRQTLWERIENNDELKSFRASLDATVNDAAKSIVLHEILKKKSVKVAQWWLERRDPEFKTRTAVDARIPEDQMVTIIRGLSGTGGLPALKKVREAMLTP